MPLEKLLQNLVRIQKLEKTPIGQQVLFRFLKSNDNQAVSLDYDDKDVNAGGGSRNNERGSV